MSRNLQKHGCYFKDGKRRADYVIVVNENTSLAPLNTYIRSLEQKGLQFEKANGITVPKIFFLVHISEEALKYYSRVYDVGIDEKKVIIEDEHISPCFQVFSTPISEIPDKKPGEYTSAERIVVINKLLESTKYGEEDSEYGISKLIRLKMVDDAYPLHDGPTSIDKNSNIEYANDRQLLHRYWSNFGVWYKQIPLDMIQKYFGCEIAFYFAWLQYFNYMLIPVAIFGLIVVIINVMFITLGQINQVDEVCHENEKYVCPTCEYYKYCMFKTLSDYCSFTKWTYVFDNYLTIAFAVVMSFWATLFINLWRRKENELKLKWSVQFKDIGTEPRQQYMDSAKAKEFNELSGKMEPVVPKYVTFLRMSFVVTVCAFVILMVVAACIVIIMYKINIISVMVISNVEYFHIHANILSIFTGSLLQVLFINLFEKIYGRLSIWLTDIENPRTQYDYDTSVLHKRYLLAFTNSYIPLFYLSFMKGKLYTIPHHHRMVTYFERDTCQPSTCILGVCIQLAFLMIFKKFSGNILTLIYVKFARKKAASVKNEDTVKDLPQYEEEYKLLPTDRYVLTSEFCEMVIDYGFVTFFVAAFPLAPLCALLNNILESRSDAYKFVAAYRRPIPRKVPGIGSWDGILLGTTYLSTATNAVVIAFTSDFVGREMYRTTRNASMIGYVNSTLSEFAIDDYDLFQDISPDIDVCYYRGIRNPPSHPNKYQLSRHYWKLVTWKLISILIFEHVVLLCNGLLGYAIPNVSSSVKQQLDMDRLLAREAKVQLMSDAIKASDDSKYDIEYIMRSFVSRKLIDDYVEVGPVVGFFTDEYDEDSGD